MGPPDRRAREKRASELSPVTSVVIAACLFAILHLPNPLLTLMTFVGALAWCAIFMRHPEPRAIGVLPCRGDARPAVCVRRWGNRTAPHWHRTCMLGR